MIITGLGIHKVKTTIFQAQGFSLGGQEGVDMKQCCSKSTASLSGIIWIPTTAKCHDGIDGDSPCVGSNPSGTPERMDKIGVPSFIEYAGACLHDSPILQKPLHVCVTCRKRTPLPDSPLATWHSDVLDEVLPQISPWVCGSVQRSNIIMVQFRWTYIGHGVIVGETWAEVLWAPRTFNAPYAPLSLLRWQ